MKQFRVIYHEAKYVKDFGVIDAASDHEAVAVVLYTHYSDRSAEDKESLAGKMIAEEVKPAAAKKVPKSG